ncbi:MAG: hypothetical protein KF862_23965 [Chitinophagaceae bacterium]|nr:hypothetical protein [Chitinophagaceae bacterium]
MYEFQSICRKKIALVILNRSVPGEVRIYAGRIILNDKARYYFVSALDWDIEIERDIIKKLQPVTKEMKEMMLGTDYFFLMTVTGQFSYSHC